MQQNNNYDDLTSGNSTSDSFNRSCSSFSPFSPFSIPRAVMAASFAAPLVSKLHWRNIIFHVYGLNPKQETAVLSLAMSIWGNPRELIFNYSDGRDALALNAELLCHLPMAIRSGSRDAELDAERSSNSKRSCKKRGNSKSNASNAQLNFIKDRGDLAYFLASEYNPWRTSIISTGAKPITYEFYAGYARCAGCLTGLYTRTIEVNSQTAQTAQQTAQQTAKNAQQTAQQTAQTAKSDDALIAPINDYAPIDTIVDVLPIFQNNYGFAGNKFISFVINLLKNDERGGEARLKADHERMMKELKPYDTHKGKLNEVAVIALADYYASLSVFGVTDVAGITGVTDESLAWQEAVELGKGILIAAIANPVCD